MFGELEKEREKRWVPVRNWKGHQHCRYGETHTKFYAFLGIQLIRKLKRLIESLPSSKFNFGFFLLPKFTHLFVLGKYLVMNSCWVLLVVSMRFTLQLDSSPMRDSIMRKMKLIYLVE